MCEPYQVNGDLNNEQANSSARVEWPTGNVDGNREAPHPKMVSDCVSGELEAG